MVHKVVHRGFSATIHAINGGNRDVVNERIKYYVEYSNRLDVFRGDNLPCLGLEKLI